MKYTVTLCCFKLFVIVLSIKSIHVAWFSLAAVRQVDISTHASFVKWPPEINPRWQIRRVTGNISFVARITVFCRIKLT